MNAIQTNDLTKYYGDKCVVDHLNLEIKEKEVFALLGVNGAGKTTTIKMLTTLIMPTSGKISIFNMDSDKEKQNIRKIINISPQETAIAPNLTVLENLEFMAGVYDIKNKQEKIDELIKEFKLQEVLKMKAGKLSGGWQRKLSIALSLINEPKILFLDEPTLGLDVIARRSLWKEIEKLKGKITIILTTHYMEEAEYLADLVGIMEKGRIKVSGKVNELIKKSGKKTFEEAFIYYVEGNDENN